MDHLLLWCGVVAGPFFIIVFLVEGWLRKGYHPLRQPVSALAIGPRGWIQRVNFFVSGSLGLAYTFGLYLQSGSIWIPLLIGACGLGLVGAGVFVTDITGLPREAPKAGQRPPRGVIHDVFSLFVFAGLFIASILYINLFYKIGEGGWALYSGASAAALLVFFVLAGVGFSGHPKMERMGGLMQRISIAAGFIWLSLVAAHAMGIQYEPAPVSQMESQGQPTFSWSYKSLENNEIPKTEVSLTAMYENGVAKTKVIDVVEGDCNTYEDSDSDIYEHSTMIICYYAGLGRYFKVIQSGDGYTVERRIFEEASPEYNPPLQPYEAVVRF